MSIIISILLTGVKKDLSKSEYKVIKEESNVRLKELLNENRNASKALKKHTDTTIFPAIAIYKTLIAHGTEKEKAVDAIRKVFFNLSEKGFKIASLWQHIAGNYHRYPSSFIKNSLRDFTEEAGFVYEIKEKENPAIARFDIVSCPYYAMCQKYNCTELTPAFCDSDDAKYSHLHPNLKWERTGTIGKGASCCDFKIVDITRYRK